MITEQFNLFYMCYFQQFVFAVLFDRTSSIFMGQTGRRINHLLGSSCVLSGLCALSLHSIFRSEHCK